MSKSWLGGRKSGVSRQVNLVGTSDDGRVGQVSRAGGLSLSLLHKKTKLEELSLDYIFVKCITFRIQILTEDHNEMSAVLYPSQWGYDKQNGVQIMGPY